MLMEKKWSGEEKHAVVKYSNQTWTRLQNKCLSVTLLIQTDYVFIQSNEKNRTVITREKKTHAHTHSHSQALTDNIGDPILNQE